MTHLSQQNSLQRDTYGIDYSKMNDEARIRNFKDMKLALEAELQEALDEMGWKPWATSRHFKKKAVQGELIDAYHFLMNLMLIAGMNDEMVDEMYMAKRDKNMDRQAEGYDGVSGKCQGCKRALDDAHTICMLVEVLWGATGDPIKAGYCWENDEVYTYNAQTNEKTVSYLGRDNSLYAMIAAAYKDQKKETK